MSRYVVNVATGHYLIGQERLRRAVTDNGLYFSGMMPPGSPEHIAVPYAFKAWALKAALDRGATSVLWADACIVPVGSMGPLWDRIERDGYWISNNGFKNSEWTADSAYSDLGVSREENEKIPHVVATAFGLSLTHPTGRRIFDEYFRLAQTNAFIGPWQGGIGVQHRHDQTALSVVAYRAGCNLTNPPEFFAYRGGETADTILCADGSY